eukprot:jgi/Chrzof1/1706/Cz10g18020.t1
MVAAKLSSLSVLFSPAADMALNSVLSVLLAPSGVQYSRPSTTLEVHTWSEGMAVQVQVSHQNPHVRLFEGCTVVTTGGDIADELKGTREMDGLGADPLGVPLLTDGDGQAGDPSNCAHNQNSTCVHTARCLVCKRDTLTISSPTPRLKAVKQSKGYCLVEGGTRRTACICPWVHSAFVHTFPKGLKNSTMCALARQNTSQ